MEVWMIWVMAGIICMIIEIFTPGFLFMSFGVGAILTGLVSILISSIPIQVLLFALITFFVFINLRKFSSKIITKPTEQTNVTALIAKKGIVTKIIPEDGKGYVKIGGEEWSASSIDGKSIEKNTKIIVDKIEGNKVIVKPWEG